MLNQKGQRELAYIVEIDGIRPIEGADRVEVAIVGGWRIMVRKGQFQPGDLAVYFEIDAQVPEKEPFQFLESKHYKIKTQKYFKGTVISQGLLMAAEDFGWKTELDGQGKPAAIGGYKKGDFLTEVLGVTYAEPEDNVRKASSKDKYQRMEERHRKLFQNPLVKRIYRHPWGRALLFLIFGSRKNEKSEWPSWVVKTDEERIQNLPWILEDRSEWIATEKIDGTSTTFTMKRGKRGKFEFFICSRNVCFDTPAKMKAGAYDASNVYQEMAVKYNIETILKELLAKVFPDAEWVTLQGETYGAGIQKREYGKEGHDFMGFNLIISNKGRLNSVKAAELMKNYDVPWVPIIDAHFVLPNTVEELLTIATGTSVVDGGMREGLVFRSQDGARSFKAVSNEYLIKYHG
jgi:hypothetical protein